MPKTAVDKDSEFQLWQHDIWFARQVFAMETKTTMFKLDVQKILALAPEVRTHLLDDLGNPGRR